MAEGLSARDIKFIATAFKCMRAKPDIDFTKFAEMNGLKGAKSARDGFRVVYKRLVGADEDGNDDAIDESASGSPVKAKVSRKRKADTPLEGKAKNATGGRGKTKKESVNEVTDDAGENYHGVDVKDEDSEEY